MNVPHNILSNFARKVSPLTTESWIVVAINGINEPVSKVAKLIRETTIKLIR